MTPIEKAEQLAVNFEVYNSAGTTTYVLAIACVNEIICANPHSSPFNDELPVTSTMDYWMEVKKELEKMNKV